VEAVKEKKNLREVKMLLWSPIREKLHLSGKTRLEVGVV